MADIDVLVRIIDKASDPFRGSRGKGLTARSQEVLEYLATLGTGVPRGDRVSTMGAWPH
ncbi:MAG: hypothetical protein ACRDRN_22385 [Sciscionella sp.]